jgi:hypothetical protein
MTPHLTRRAFVGSSVALAAASAPSLAQGAYRPGLLLLDPTLGSAEALGLTAPNYPHGIVDLAPDIVRAWRDGLELRVREHGGAIAITRWAGAQVLAGLVREAGGKAALRPFGASGQEVLLSLPSAQGWSATSIL